MCQNIGPSAESAMSSSIWNANEAGFGPLFAIDYMNSMYATDYFSSAEEMHPWFMLDFGMTVDISAVKIMPMAGTWLVVIHYPSITNSCTM